MEEFHVTIYIKRILRGPCSEIYCMCYCLLDSLTCKIKRDPKLAQQRWSSHSIKQNVTACFSVCFSGFESGFNILLQPADVSHILPQLLRKISKQSPVEPANPVWFWWTAICHSVLWRPDKEPFVWFRCAGEGMHLSVFVPLQHLVCLNPSLVHFPPRSDSAVEMWTQKSYQDRLEEVVWQ